MDKVTMDKVAKFFTLTNNLKLFYINYLRNECLYKKQPEEKRKSVIRSIDDIPSIVSRLEDDVLSDFDSDESINISYNLALRRSQTLLNTIDSIDLSFGSPIESSDILDRIRDAVSEEIKTAEIEDSSSETSFNPFKEN